MSKMKNIVAALVVALGMVSAANASVIVDGTPTGSYVNSWGNTADNQNFMVQFTLTGTTQITALDIFTGKDFAAIGTAATVRIRADESGTAAAENLYEYLATVTGSTSFDGDSNISSVAIAPLTLNAGSYWFGVSGTTTELSWNSYNNGGASAPANQIQMYGNLNGDAPAIYNLAYQIEGTTGGNVPEPGSVALLGLALGGLLLARRKHVG